MKFKQKDFTGLPTDCDTVKEMREFVGNREFTMEELQKKFPYVSNCIEQGLRYIIKEKRDLYLKNYWNITSNKLLYLVEREKSINHKYYKKEEIKNIEEHNRQLTEEMEQIKILMDSKLPGYNDYKFRFKDKSDAIVSMNIVWKGFQKNSYRTTNNVMHECLSNLIKAGVEFNIEDFNHIRRNYNAGYWYSNSKEQFYRICIEWNTSALKAFEHSYQRVPFILKNKRMYVGKRLDEKVELPNNKYKMMYHFITSFTDDNQRIRVKSSSDYEAKKDYKLQTFTKEEFKAFFKDKNIAV